MSLQSIETSSVAFPLQLLHILEEISHRVANEYAEAIAELRLPAVDAGNAQIGAVLGNVRTGCGCTPMRTGRYLRRPPAVWSTSLITSAMSALL